MGDFVPKKKTQIDDIERTIYDITNEDRSAYKSASGLTEEIICDISARKHDPAWMLDFRLKSLKVYHETPMPAWGPDLSALNMDEIVTYVRPDAKMVGDWNEVPEDIKDTFDRLGIPEAEKSSLAGVGAQYDSEVVYHSIQESLVKQGVVYTDMETALQEYGDIVQRYFMTLVPPKAHKFAALHGAVWSGGSFVYVPEGIQVDIPLQSYFRLNAAGAGQFEHTLIIVEKGASLHFIEGCSAPKYNVTNLHAGCVELFVKEGARLRYSTIENWSRNMMNLNTKRALVETDGLIEWVSGSFGSHASTPCCPVVSKRMPIPPSPTISTTASRCRPSPAKSSNPSATTPIVSNAPIPTSSSAPSPPNGSTNVGDSKAPGLPRTPRCMPGSIPTPNSIPCAACSNTGTRYNPSAASCWSKGV